MIRTVHRAPVRGIEQSTGRVIRLCLAGLLLWALTMHTAPAREDLSHCVGSDAAFEPLPDLQYRCLRTSSGSYVLTAQTTDTAKPAVLFVHGMGSNAHRDWKYTYPSLAGSHRVVLLDLPGFGLSDPLRGGYSFAGLAAAVEEIAQELDLQRFDLVGHSLGAALSLYYADRYPDRVRRLVLVDAAGVLSKQVFARQLLEANRSATVDSVMDMLGQGTGDAWFDVLEDQLDASARLLEIPAIRGAVLGLPIHADAALGLVEHDFTAAIRSIDVPTFVIWGEGDSVTPLRTGQLLASRMRDAKLQTIADAQHMPMIERPQDFNRVLTDALNGAWPAEQSVERVDSQGEVVCRDQANVVYRGTFDSISLNNCTDVRIERAFLKRLSIEGGSVELLDVRIAADKIALRAENASVTGTAVELSGATALDARGSRIDLAGATLRARDAAVSATGSRIYFSVSEIDAPDYRGGAHGRWRDVVQ